MTYEEVKDVLGRYIYKRERVLKLKATLDRTKADKSYFDTLRSIDYTKPRVQGGIQSSQVEQAVMAADAVIERLEQEYANAADDMFRTEDRIAKMLPYLDEQEQGLIIDRYMDGVDFMTIAHKYYYQPESLLNKYTKIYKKMANAESDEVK